MTYEVDPIIAKKANGDEVIFRMVTHGMNPVLGPHVVSPDTFSMIKVTDLDLEVLNKGTYIAIPLNTAREIYEKGNREMYVYASTFGKVSRSFWLRIINKEVTSITSSVDADIVMNYVNTLGDIIPALIKLDASTEALAYVFMRSN